MTWSVKVLATSPDHLILVPTVCVTEEKNQFCRLNPPHVYYSVCTAVNTTKIHEQINAKN